MCFYHLLLTNPTVQSVVQFYAVYGGQVCIAHMPAGIHGFLPHVAYKTYSSVSCSILCSLWWKSMHSPNACRNSWVSTTCCLQALFCVESSRTEHKNRRARGTQIRKTLLMRRRHINCMQRSAVPAPKGTVAVPGRRPFRYKNNLLMKTS